MSESTQIIKCTQPECRGGTVADKLPQTWRYSDLTDAEKDRCLPLSDRWEFYGNPEGEIAPVFACQFCDKKTAGFIGDWGGECEHFGFTCVDTNYVVVIGIYEEAERVLGKMGKEATEDLLPYWSIAEVGDVEDEISMVDLYPGIVFVECHLGTAAYLYAVLAAFRPVP